MVWISPFPARVESGRSHSGNGTKVAAELFSRREWQIVDTEAVVQIQPVSEDAPHQTLEVASILSFRAVGIIVGSTHSSTHS